MADQPALRPANLPPYSPDEGEKEKAMKVFRNECDHYVAEDLDDAWKVFEELTLCKRADHEPDDPIEEVPGDKKLKILCDEDGHPSDSGTVIERTIAEWAEREPRGMLCSTEF